MYPEPDGAVIAAMLSSQTTVGWLEIRLPPDSAFAFAAQSGFTYIFAPTKGLSTCGQLVQLVGVGVGDDVGVGDVVGRRRRGRGGRRGPRRARRRRVGLPVVEPLQVTPLSVKLVGTLLVVVQLPLKPMPVSVAPVAMLPL